MKFHLSDQHIVICIFQNRDDHTAFTSDRFQFIWRCTEDNLKVLVFEEIKHQFDIVVTHFFERLINKDQSYGIDSHIVEHGECRRQNQRIWDLRSGTGIVSYLFG